MTRACIFGLSGTELSDEERAFFTEVQPLGFILFRRNVDTPDQVRAALTTSLKACVNREPFILIDQEGGRTRCLRPPHWPDYLPAALYRDNLPARLRKSGELVLAWRAALMAQDLRGSRYQCRLCPGARPAAARRPRYYRRSRLWHDAREEVAVMGRAACEGFLAGGVLPIVKHIPGHGRAGADSHAALPIVESGYDELLATDFYPFQVCADMPLAMTAHVLYRAIDKKHPATTSKKAIRLIRRRYRFRWRDHLRRPVDERVERQPFAPDTRKCARGLRCAPAL